MKNADVAVGSVYGASQAGLARGSQPLGLLSQGREVGDLAPMAPGRWCRCKCGNGRRWRRGGASSANPAMTGDEFGGGSG
jgi:hypothetical protein